MNNLRIIFKDDRESVVGRGCFLKPGHLREEVMCMVRAAADTVPHGTRTMIVSEGWRPARYGRRDLHSDLRAFDISLNTLGISDPRARREVGERWAERIRAVLGIHYTVVVHGEGYNLHIHIELDP